MVDASAVDRAAVATLASEMDAEAVTAAAKAVEVRVSESAVIFSLGLRSVHDSSIRPCAPFVNSK